MKLFLMIIMLFSMSVYAEQPKYLEGAVITVKLKNGKTYKYDSKQMAVVPRSKEQPKKHICPEKVVVKQVFQAMEERRIVPNKKNRVYLLGGYGPNGELDVSSNSSRYRVTQHEDFVGGIGYQRKIGDTYNLGLQLQNNNTSSLSLGLDF